MKLTKDEKAGSGKERYVFHIGADEIRLLLALIHTASKYTPRVLETGPTHARLQQMRKEFIHTLNPPNIRS